MYSTRKMEIKGKRNKDIIYFLKELDAFFLF
jgi:hypothetical protein